MALTSAPSVDQVKECLIKLRQGQGLARPTTLLSALDESVRTYLCRGHDCEPNSAAQIAVLAKTIGTAIDQLADHERLYVQVDFNLIPEHRFATLTDRQESLASHQKCATKTVRRHAARALDTLAYLLIADPVQPAATAMQNVAAPQRALAHGDLIGAVCDFWKLEPGTRVDIVCSEIPDGERPDYASPSDRNYLRYAKFADLDTLIFVRTRLAQLAPTVVVRDFAPSEHYDTHADVLVVIGGPPWNATYRKFLPQLPFRFDPHPLGQDDPLVVPELDDLTLAPRWTADHELIEDLAVLTRLTVQGTTVFLLGGCLTLGVLGAARCVLDTGRGAANAGYLTDRIGSDDFVLVTEARRVGGITDVADLTAVEPLLLLSRPTGERFGVVIDNSKRYVCRDHPAACAE
ncbi:hypothetical protein [Nocardia sp. CS682]|uniref:hypothetical protein n=1 Tax=Nocardia sp. CS682 TaxID=1047172 RepID=UPI001074F747|nr:hypothetical protein [Nocardia sp. CS682]QBS41312.1 hypothetical protein DMB37_15465 [Nocardia sp. CS682]